MKLNQFLSLFLLMCLAACAPAFPASLPANMVGMATATPEWVKATATPTSTVTSEPTFIPTATEKLPAQDIWQVSPDGHIAYNEAQLYGGLFTIDREHPEITQKCWEQFISGLWNLNYISKNDAFLALYPTDQALSEHIINGDKVDNLWIPVQYPNTGRQYWNAALMVPIESPINFSQIGIAIYEPTPDEIKNYNPVYSPNKRFMSYNGAYGEVAIEINKIGGNDVLTFTLRSDLSADYTTKFFDNMQGTLLALDRKNKTPDENRLAAAQHLNVWLLQMQTHDNILGNAWISKWDPPGVKFIALFVSTGVLKKATTVEGSPFVLRK